MVGWTNYVFHLFEIILKFTSLLGLFGAVFVDLLEPFANIFLVFLATLVKLYAWLVVRDPTLAKVAKLSSLRLPVVGPKKKTKKNVSK